MNPCCIVLAIIGIAICAIGIEMLVIKTEFKNEGKKVRR